MAEPQFRLVIRSDFYGLVCAVLFKDLGIINDILFVHPKERCVHRNTGTCQIENEKYSEVLSVLIKRINQNE